jgi:hypothetical protein
MALNTSGCGNVYLASVYFRHAESIKLISRVFMISCVVSCLSESPLPQFPWTCFRAVEAQEEFRRGAAAVSGETLSYLAAHYRD